VEYQDLWFQLQAEKLQRITKRTVNIQVVEIQFQGDVTVAGYTHAFLTKGGDPSVPLDSNGIAKVKEEPVDYNRMDVDTSGAGKPPINQADDAVDATFVCNAETE
jgi:hypothetical protein